MKYKIGYSIKPSRIDDGVVYFTDGTNEILPSEKSCVDYGYVWDKSSGTCVVKTRTNIDLNNRLEETTNKIGGKQNYTKAGVQNSIVYGESNTFSGKNKNTLVLGNNNSIGQSVKNTAILSGSDNIVSDYVENAAILSGSGAKSIRSSEVITGGFKTTGLDRIGGGTTNFTTQSSQFNMQVMVDNSASLHYLKNADGNEYWDINPLSFMYITAHCLATGDGLGKIVGGTITGTVSAGSNGNPIIVSQNWNSLATGLAIIPAKTFSLATKSIGGKVYLGIRALGNAGQKILLSANVNVVEVIHDENTDI